MVVARLTEEGELYRAKMISISNKLATVLFIDYGESEQQSVDSLKDV